MGLFTYVEIPPNLLPEGCQHISCWQTKDVIEPWMDTLIIMEDGKLILQWWERVREDDPEIRKTKGYFKRKIEHKVEIPFHGDMEIIGGDFQPPFVKCVCRFTEGKLDWIKERER